MSNLSISSGSLEALEKRIAPASGLFSNYIQWGADLGDPAHNALQTPTSTTHDLSGDSLDSHGGFTDSGTIGFSANNAMIAVQPFNISGYHDGAAISMVPGDFTAGQLKGSFSGALIGTNKNAEVGFGQAAITFDGTNKMTLALTGGVNGSFSVSGSYQVGNDGTVHLSATVNGQQINADAHVSADGQTMVFSSTDPSSPSFGYFVRAGSGLSSANLTSSSAENYYGIGNWSLHSNNTSNTYEVKLSFTSATTFSLQYDSTIDNNFSGDTPITGTWAVSSTGKVILTPAAGTTQPLLFNTVFLSGNLETASGVNIRNTTTDDSGAFFLVRGMDSGSDLSLSKTTSLYSSDGDLMTLSLSAATAHVTFKQQSASFGGPTVTWTSINYNSIDTIQITSSTASSSLALTLARGPLSTTTAAETINSIQTTSSPQSLGTLSMASGYTVHDVTISGYLTTLTLDQVASDGSIQIGHSALDNLDKSTVKFGTLGAGASLDVNGSIVSVTGTAMGAHSSINASGSMGAVLLSGAMQGSLSAASITSVTAKSMNGDADSSGSSDHITATAGTIGLLKTTGGGLQNFQIDAPGLFTGFSVTNSTATGSVVGINHVSVSAGSMGTTVVTLSGGSGLTSAVGIDNSTFDSSGAMGAVTVSVSSSTLNSSLTGVLDSSFQAATTLGALTLSAKNTATASSGSAIVAQNLQTQSASLGNILITGLGGSSVTGLDDSVFTTTGSVGTITISSTSPNVAAQVVGLQNTAVNAGTAIGAISITGKITGTTSVTGSATAVSVSNDDDSIQASGNISSVAIVAAGGFTNAGINTDGSEFIISAGGAIGTVHVTSTKIVGGSSFDLENTRLSAGTKIAQITLDGSASTAQATSFDVYAGQSITGLVISSSADPTQGSLISSSILAGQTQTFSTATDLSLAALGPVTISGALQNSLLAAGSNIGTVTIGTNATTSNIVAGVQLGNDHDLGGGNDSYIQQASISAVTIKGVLSHTSIIAGVNPNSNGWGDSDDVLGTNLGFGTLGKVGLVTLGASNTSLTTNPFVVAAIQHDYAIEGPQSAGVKVGAFATFLPTTTAFYLAPDNSAESVTDTLVRLVTS